MNNSFEFIVLRILPHVNQTDWINICQEVEYFLSTQLDLLFLGIMTTYYVVWSNRAVFF